MKEKRSFKTRRGLYGAIAAIVVVFLLTASTAYPKPWNAMSTAVKDVTGISIPQFSTEPFTLGLDLKGGLHLVYEADMSSIDEADRANALEGVRDVIERRVNAFGVSEPVVQTTIEGDHYRVIIDLAGVYDAQTANALIGETPILEFKTQKDESEIETTLTDEQEAQMESDQTTQEADALAILDRALAGGDFGQLAREASIATTSFNNGYVGYVGEDDDVFGELISQIEDDGLAPGVIDGLYESGSSMYVVDYLSSKQEEEVYLSHILICYSGASGCTQERTREEAFALAYEIKARVTPETFAQEAIDNSSDGSASSGGSLGLVAKGMMVQAFEDAAFALQDGQISDVVETEYGYHLIYRSGTEAVTQYELAEIEMPWTTESDLLVIDPWENTELSGKYLEHSSVGFNPSTGVPYVLLNFDSEGAELFGTLTEENIGKQIGIFLDGAVISAPVVQDAIYGGEATIVGDFTVEEAKILSQRLNAGALPVPVELISQSTLGPTLGAESLASSILAGFIGLLLIGIFMIVYYRLPGLLATLALISYAAMNLALYKWLGVTLTLSGIAGFVLSVGIAVDANVLIFSRLKEELKSGRDLTTAIDEGFRRAWTSIRDGNLTVLIAAAVLFNLSGFIKGFALTLAIGILVSLASALFVTRILLQIVSQWKWAQHPWLYGVHKK